MFHLTFQRGEPRELTCATAEELHETVHKRYPNAVYTIFGSSIYQEEPPDAPVILVWRNVKEQEGKYGTGNWACRAVGWVFRDDATVSEKHALCERFAKDEWEINQIRIAEDTDRMRPR